MKTKSFITAAILACLCLGACSEQNISEPSFSNQSDSCESSASNLENDNNSESNSESTLGQYEEIPLGESSDPSQQAENLDIPSSESSDKNNEGYTIEKSPFFSVTLENIGKIYAYDAALGEGWAVIDSDTIETIIEKIRDIVFYNETPSVDPVVETLSHQCFEYFEFYKDTEDTIPIFSMGLDPFYIEIEGEKFGPYVTDVPDGFVTELLKLFLTGR